MTQIDLYKTDDTSNTINKTLTKTGSKNVSLLFNYDFIEFQAYLKGDPILLSSNYAIIDLQGQGETGMSFKTFTTNYIYDQQGIDTYSTPGYTGIWSVNETTSNLKIGDMVKFRCTNSTTNNYSFINAKVTEIPGDKLITATSIELKVSTESMHYFLNLENIGSTIYLVTFTLDLLETYKDILLASDFDISEKSTIDYNSEIPTSSELEQKTIKADKELEFTNTIVLTSTGEEIS